MGTRMLMLARIILVRVGEGSLEGEGECLLPGSFRFGELLYIDKNTFMHNIHRFIYFVNSFAERSTITKANIYITR